MYVNWAWNCHQHHASLPKLAYRRNKVKCQVVQNTASMKKAKLWPLWDYHLHFADAKVWKI